MQKSGKSCKEEVLNPGMVYELTETELETVVGGAGLGGAVSSLGGLGNLTGVGSLVDLDGIVNKLGSIGNIKGLTGGN